MNANICYTMNQTNFNKIPGSPIAYWVTLQLVNAFEKGIKLETISNVRQGIIPGNVDMFLRLWYEVSQTKIGYNHRKSTDIIKYNKKWFLYNKGGSFRRWYGNIEYVINMENNGYAIKYSGLNNNYRLRDPELYFKEAISWSKISSGTFSMRYIPEGCLFDIAGCSCFNLNDNLNYVLSFTNSKVALVLMEFLSPTLNYEVEHIKKIPLIFFHERENKINHLCNENIQLSKSDWDSFETSWDFKKHPLI